MREHYERICNGDDWMKNISKLPPLIFNYFDSGLNVGLGSLKLSFANGDILHIDNDDGNDLLDGGTRADVMAGLFRICKFDAANDTEERMAA